MNRCNQNRFIDHLQDKRRRVLNVLENSIITEVINRHPEAAQDFEECPWRKEVFYTTKWINIINDIVVNARYAEFLNVCGQLGIAIDKSVI